VEYLAALGHERLGLVTGPQVEMHTTDLCEGFFAALEEFRLSLHPEWRIELSLETANKDGACEALAPTLASANRPTGIVFASDWMALGGYKAARQAGLSVPQELSVISHDNLPLSAELSPALTTFDVEPGRVADLLVQLVTDMERNRLSENAVQREIHIVPELVKRQSCACLRLRAHS
jgi:LacI family transcriptional regulator